MTAAGLMGFLVGFPTLRVKGLYLGIATFGFGEIVRLAFLNIKYTKMVGGKLVGPNGAEGFRHVSYIYDRGFTQVQYLAVIYAAVIVVAGLVYPLQRSELGGKLRALEAGLRAGGPAPPHDAPRPAPLEDLRRREGPAPAGPRGQDGRDLRHDRAQRLRQDHALQRRRRRLSAD